MTRTRTGLYGLLAGGALIFVTLPVLAQDGDAPTTPPPPAGPPAFDAIDTNKDGQISRAEFDAFRPPHCPPEGFADKGGKGPPPGGPEALDRDGDGRLSWAEFSAPMKAHFDAADINKNGFIDGDETLKGPMMTHHSRMEKPDGKPDGAKDRLMRGAGPCGPKKGPEKP